MQAWILDESPGSYRYGEVPDPAVGPDDVRVRPVASALNHMDLWVTKGKPRPHLPHVPGCDVAGVVEAVGSAVEGVAVGDEVVVNPRSRPRDGRGPRRRRPDAPRVPDRRRAALGWPRRAGGRARPQRGPQARERTWSECAAFPLATLTAYRMLRRARLRAGESVLIVGIGGGVSMAALALAQTMGATVYGTSRDAETRRRAEEAGATACFASDEPWPVRCEVVLESVGPATWERSVGALVPGGRLVVCGGTSGPVVEVNLPRLFFKQHEIIGSTMGGYGEFAEVVRLVEQGLPVAVDLELPVERYPDALERLASGRHLGKVVLRHDGAADDPGAA
ncbi:MAG: zinc-binding dehydrogenase [Acidimicrobiales bacterium]